MSRPYTHTPENCPSKHYNDGNDVCADCGKDLQATGPDTVYEKDAPTPKAEKWRAYHTFEQVQYADGSGELLMCVYGTQDGLEVTGNGSIQAPLKAVVTDLLKLLPPDLREAMRSVVGAASSYTEDLASGLEDRTYDEDLGCEEIEAACDRVSRFLRIGEHEDAC